MKFIKLTSIYGEPININMDLIESYGRESSFYKKSELKDGDMYTYLFPASSKCRADAYVVKETPTQIYDLLK